MRGEIADDCKVLSQQTWEQERVNTWTTVYHRLTVRSIFFPCPSLLSRPHRGSTTPESNESCLHNSEWSKSTPRFRPRGCRVDSKDSKGLCTHFGNCYYYVQVLNFAVSKRRDRFSRKIDLIF